jgi:asparagine synthase (glutamine-hydrolysing)
MDQVLYGDIKSYLLDDILVKIDRMTMANSLEGRCPLLDQELIQFTASLPLNLKIRGGRGKYLLRKVAEKLLPPDTLSKGKQGFGIPLKEWFQHELREMTADIILSQSFRERGVFQPKSVERCLSDHVHGHADHGEQLWLMLSFELWARQFLDVNQVCRKGTQMPETIAGTA